MTPTTNGSGALLFRWRHTSKEPSCRACLVRVFGGGGVLGSCLVIEMNQVIESSGGRSRARNSGRATEGLILMPERRRAPRHGRADLATRGISGPKDMRNKSLPGDPSWAPARSIPRGRMVNTSKLSPSDEGMRPVPSRRPAGDQAKGGPPSLSCGMRNTTDVKSGTFLCISCCRHNSAGQRSPG
jgi:hypothetical protein